MKKRYLVYYERNADTTGRYFDWGGFCPDLPGCVSVGETLEEMRIMMREAIEGLMESMAEDGDPIPEPATTSIDFASETPSVDVEYCVVEWLEVRMPSQVTLASQQAALLSSAQEQTHHG